MTLVDDAALSGVKVVDMSGPDGHYCGKLLAELGAEVVLVEPSAGSALRHQGPWLHDELGSERSLAFSYLNSSKKSAVIDLPRDGSKLLRLLRTADILIESDESEQLVDQLGLTAGEVERLFPGLIRTSITHYGSTGPYAGRPASDLAVLAEGGMMSLVGYPDLPMNLPFEQAYLAASQFAAVGALIALLDRDATGLGQNVEVSAHEAVTLALENAAQTFDLEGTVRERFGSKQRLAGSGVFACMDGSVLLLAGGIGSTIFWSNMLDFMESLKPGSTAELRGDEWGRRDFLSGRAAKRTFRRVFEAFTADLSMRQLDELGTKWRVPLAPVNTVAAAAQSEQLEARGFFVDLEIDDVTVRMPGAPYQLSETPWVTSHRAPRLGEHTAEVLGPRDHGVALREVEGAL